MQSLLTMVTWTTILLLILFLKKRGVPATIYLTTGLVGTLDGIWTEQIGLAFLETKKDYFNFSALLGDKAIRIKTKEEKGTGQFKGVRCA